MNCPEHYIRVNLLNQHSEKAEDTSYAKSSHQNTQTHNWLVIWDKEAEQDLVKIVKNKKTQDFIYAELELLARFADEFDHQLLCKSLIRLPLAGQVYFVHIGVYELSFICCPINQHLIVFDFRIKVS